MKLSLGANEVAGLLQRIQFCSPAPETEYGN